MEEKEEEAWTSFWKVRNFRPLPETSGHQNLRPSRSFRSCCTEAVQECANSLDTLPGLSPGTSGARTFRPSPELLALSARGDSGRGPCTLSPPRLYILLHPVHFRVSTGLAHICERAFAHPLGYFSSEFRTSSEKIPQADSRPPSWEDPLVDSRPPLGDELSFVSLPLLIVDHMYLFVFGDLALV